MIDETRTLELYGYTSDELSKGSHKSVVVICEDCGKYRTTPMRDYRDLCLSCARKGNKNSLGFKQSKETILKRSLAQTGDKNCNYGKPRSKETKQKISQKLSGIPLTEETKRKISENSAHLKGEKHPMYGKHHSEETKRKISVAGMGNTYCKGKIISEETRRKHSASAQGITVKEWKGYLQDKKYCEKFNEGCREHNREKYLRMCFICGKDEVFNGQKLSVHHVDRNKDQGCNDHNWSLVPLCKKHHGSCHNDLWESRIMYLLDNVW